MPEITIDMTPPPDPPLTFGHESRWKVVGRWALRLVTFGIVARYGKLQPRDIIPGLVAAALAGRSGHVPYIELVDQVARQIEMMAWDKATKRTMRAEAVSMLWDRYTGQR